MTYIADMRKKIIKNSRGIEAVAGEPALKKYRDNYLHMIQSVREEGDFLIHCLDIMVMLISTERFKEFIAAFIQLYADDEERGTQLPDNQFAVMTFLSRLDAFRWDNSPTTTDKIVRSLIDFLDKPEAKPNKNIHCNFLTYLERHLSLTNEEMNILSTLFLFEGTRHFNDLRRAIASLDEFNRLLILLTGAESKAILRAVSPSSKLIRTRLIEQQGDILALGDNVLAAMHGDLSLKDFQFEYFQRDTTKGFPTNSFDIRESDLDVMKLLLGSQGPSNILFYGKPGSGKTELARSIIRAVGKKALVVPPRIREDGVDRLRKIYYSIYFGKDAVFIIDEAESTLNTEGRFMVKSNEEIPTKSHLNTFLDECNAKIIWIANDTGGIHESTLRRFDFKLHFDKLSLKQREQAMDLILAKHQQTVLKSEKYIQDAVKDEYITPGILDNVIRSFTRMQSTGMTARGEVLIPRLLASHKPEREQKSDLAQGEDNYQLSAINTSDNLDQVLFAANMFYKCENKPGAGINFLLHGLPGTGKTEFVKYLAKQAGRDLLFKRGSDLLSMWLGGTEKLISEAFREASAKQAILLIDEADTFFQPRENAQRSWEVSQTNEFLNQMENHNILLFCCTNLIDKLDAASMRRFHFKLEFKPMAQDKRADFFAEYFKEFFSESAPDITELASALAHLNTLTPGDFRAVRQRFQFKTLSTHWQELVKALEAEGRYKQQTQGRAIGFER